MSFLCTALQKGSIVKLTGLQLLLFILPPLYRVGSLIQHSNSFLPLASSEKSTYAPPAPVSENISWSLTECMGKGKHGKKTVSTFLGFLLNQGWLTCSLVRLKAQHTEAPLQPQSYTERQEHKQD